MRAHAGLNHEKLVMLYGQHMSIFGSSNWTSSSDDSQEEHNCFCTDLTMFNWFTTMFERKWNNSTGVIENSEFTPLPPNKPVNQAPQTPPAGLSSSVTLKWYGGPWAHKYDVLIGTDPNNLTPLVSRHRSSDRARRRPTTRVCRDEPASGDDLLLARGRANDGERQQDRRHLVLHHQRHRCAAAVNGPIAQRRHRALRLARDGLPGPSGRSSPTRPPPAASGCGTRMPARPRSRPPRAARRATWSSPSPPSPGKPYHLWIRGRADGNVYTNDSAFVQFSNSVTSTGAATMRIGTTSAAEYNLENCNGCGSVRMGLAG